MLQRYFRYILFVVFALAHAAPAAAVDRNPLLAVDASSPRATLQTLHTLAAEVEDTVISMRAAPSAASQAKIYRLMQKLGSLFDLSDIPPASRRDAGRDAIVFLVDVLRRIDVPQLEAIPGDDQFPDLTKPASWTIPGTEITISRVLSGPKAGKFAFDKDTVARAGEFYTLVKNLPLKAASPYFELANATATTAWVDDTVEPCRRIAGSTQGSSVRHADLEDPGNGCALLPDGGCSSQSGLA